MCENDLMIISEKQIMQLIHFSNEYRRELLISKEMKTLSIQGERSLDDVCMILEIITNQQSEELKEFK